ncbi:MAG TPA: extracellular solute-binding protein [Acidimicrobiales bacterium]|nr:extracellular solute-binding protein [Acidimicrobiales bacterium]
MSVISSYLAVAMSASTAAVASTRPAATTGGSITMWGYFNPTGANGEVAQANLLKQWVKLFEQASPGSTVNYTYIPFNQMDGKLIAAAAAHTGPDVVLLNGGSTAADALGGALANSTAYFQSSGLLKAYPSGVVHSVSGKDYSIQPYVNLLGMMYNANILHKLHLSVPTNYTQFVADMKAAKAAGYWGMVIPGSPDGEGEFSSHPWLTNAGFEFAHPTMSALVAGLSYPAEWVADGYISKADSTLNNDTAYTNWLQGKTLFSQSGNWNLGVAVTQAKFKWGAFPIPLGPRGKIYLGGEALAVGAFTSKATLADTYLSAALSSQGSLDTLAVGSIPSRLDLASNPKIASNALIKPYAAEIRTNGGDYPDPGIKPADVDQEYTIVGQAWSAVIAGESPAKAAATLLPPFKKIVVGASG